VPGAAPLVVATDADEAGPRLHVLGLWRRRRARRTRGRRGRRGRLVLRRRRWRRRRGGDLLAASILVVPVAFALAPRAFDAAEPRRDFLGSARLPDVATVLPGPVAREPLMTRRHRWNSCRLGGGARVSGWGVMWGGWR